MNSISPISCRRITQWSPNFQCYCSIMSSEKLEKRINKCDIDEEPVPINRSPFIKIVEKDE